MTKHIPDGVTEAEYNQAVADAHEIWQDLEREREARTLGVRVKLADHLKTSAEVKAILAELEGNDGFCIDVDGHHYEAGRNGIAFIEGGPREPGTPEQADEHVREWRGAEFDAMMAEGESERAAEAGKLH
jgi:hypothetical protein